MTELCCLSSYRNGHNYLMALLHKWCWYQIQTKYALKRNSCFVWNWQVWGCFFFLLLKKDFNLNSLQTVNFLVTWWAELCAIFQLWLLNSCSEDCSFHVCSLKWVWPFLQLCSIAKSSLIFYLLLPCGSLSALQLPSFCPLLHMCEINYFPFDN